jgi:hypothetical protein
VVATLVGLPLMVLIRRACRDFFAGRRLLRGSVPLGGDSIVHDRRLAEVAAE